MQFLCRTLILGAVLLSLIGCNTNVTPPPILIGHVSDKTRLDRAGDQTELGIRLALSEIQKDGSAPEGLGGRKIEVRHTDTRGELAAYESQSVRLDAVNRCMALLGGLSAKEVTALDHVKTPILTFHGQPVSGASNEVFYLGMAPSHEGEVLAEVVAEDAKRKQVVILQDERRSAATTFTESFQKALAEARAKAKMEPCTVVVLRFNKQVEWSEVVPRIDSQKPNAIVFAGGVEDFNAWHKIFSRDSGAVDSQIVFAGNDGSAAMFDLNDVKASVLLTTTFYADPASAKIEAFIKTYKAAFHTEPDVHSALAYDGFRMLVEAMKKSGTQLTPERIREELAKTKDFDGLTGPLTINADRQVQRPLFVVRWQKGTLALHGKPR